MVIFIISNLSRYSEEAQTRLQMDHVGLCKGYIGVYIMCIYIIDVVLQWDIYTHIYIYI